MTNLDDLLTSYYGDLLARLDVRCAGITDGRADLHKLFGNVPDDIWSLLLLGGFDSYPGIRTILPQMPPVWVQDQWTGRHGYELAVQTAEFYKYLKDEFARFGPGPLAKARVLDFGCGWGRHLRYLAKDVPNEQLFGVDSDPEILDLIKGSSVPGKVVLTSARPDELPVEGPFQLIYSFSVFTHLSERTHWACLKALHGALADDGLILLTIRPRQLLADMAPEALPDFDAGSYVFLPHLRPSLDGDVPYGDAFIPTGYIAQNWRGLFTVERYGLLLNDLMQIVVALRKARADAISSEPGLFGRAVNSFRTEGPAMFARRTMHYLLTRNRRRPLNTAAKAARPQVASSSPDASPASERTNKNGPSAVDAALQDEAPAAEISWSGFCPICDRPTLFHSSSTWLRDHLQCASCESIPRERGLMLALKDAAPDWRRLRIHESPPTPRGVSRRLQTDCPGYVPTHFFLDAAPGSVHRGFRCEDLERQTFPDESFDVVVTLDVMEHVFRPDLVYQEVWRTLRPGGVYVHTTPIYKDRLASERCAERADDGSVRHLVPPEYHGNPIDRAGSLVTYRYGFDLADLIAAWAPFDVEIRRFNDRRHGVVGEFTEVIICRKR